MIEAILIFGVGALLGSAITWVVASLACTEGARDGVNQMVRAGGQAVAPDWMRIPSRWQPTAQNVNALPAPLFEYVRDLETRCDPAGEVRELILMRDECAGLRMSVAALVRETEEYAHSMALRYHADMRAIKMWREEAPIERDLTWPSHDDLCVWLLKRLDDKENQNDRPQV